MENRNFGMYRSIFDRLYLGYFRALLGSRLYAIFREGEELVLRPAKYSSEYSATALGPVDFSFLKNLPEEYKVRLMDRLECGSCKLSDLSYDEYIKTYGRYIEDGKALYKGRVWGNYVDPLYADLASSTSRSGYKEAFRKFDYISLENEYHLSYGEDDLMYVFVDSAMGIVIGGNDYLKSQRSYWREGEKWEYEEWHLNVFTTSFLYSKLVQLFEDFCEKNYEKDVETGQFYVIPFSDIEKWEVSFNRRTHKLPIHKMCHYFRYDESTDMGGWCNPNLYLVGKDGYKQRI